MAILRKPSGDYFKNNQDTEMAIKSLGNSTNLYNITDNIYLVYATDYKEDDEYNMTINELDVFGNVVILVMTKEGLVQPKEGELSDIINKLSSKIDE